MIEHKIFFKVEDDVVVKYTPVHSGMDGITYKTEIIMDKETFQECYKKWIEPQESENKQ